MYAKYIKIKSASTTHDQDVFRLQVAVQNVVVVHVLADRDQLSL
jgi:hypothetical protein